MRIRSFFGRSPGSGSASSLAGRPSGRTLAAAFLLLWAFDSCRPGDALMCADGLACADGQRCVAGPEQGQSQCVPTCDGNAACADAAPICDRREQICRTCFAGEDAACQLRDPKNPRCGGGRCVQCVSPGPGSAQAVECQPSGAALASAPVCDKQQNTCRSCQRHSECDSGVCAKDGSGEPYGIPQGSCVPVEQVMVVNQDLCTRDGPVFCTVKQALDRVDMKHRYIVLRKGAVPGDFTELQIGYLPSHQMYPLTLIGPLADASPISGTSLPAVSLGGDIVKDALTITSSRVVIEGLYIRDSRAGITCSGATAQLRIVRSLLAGNSTAVTVASGCNLTVDQSWFGRGPAPGAFAELAKNARSVDVTASDFWVLNSVFTDNGDPRVDGFGGVRVHSLSVGPRTRSGIINSTFMEQSGLLKQGKYYLDVLCDTPVGDRLVVMNTLLFSAAPLKTAPEEHYIDPSCGASLHRNASNDPVLSADRSLVLPGAAMVFADAAGRDLHLGPRLSVAGGSPSDGGVASLDLTPDHIVAPAVDLNGYPRNQPGGAVSIGAYEASQ